MDGVPCAARCRLRTGELRVPLRWRLEHLAPLLRYASHWRPTSRASSPTREWPLSGRRGGGGRDGRAERRPAADGGSPPRRPSAAADELEGTAHEAAADDRLAWPDGRSGAEPVVGVGAGADHRGVPDELHLAALGEHRARA